MRLKPFIILIVSLIAAQRSMGQQHATDTVLKGQTIEVIQSYKPQVRKAPKPEWLPQLPPADTSRPVLNFDVPQQTLYYSYSSGALRPLALGRDSLQIPFPNYVKAGAGNLSTLYLDAGIGNLKGKNFETGIHLHHISQKGAESLQQSALSGLEAEGVLHAKNNEWHAFTNVERNQYYFYGIFPHATTQPVIDEDKLKQTFTTVRVGIDMQNKVADEMRTIVYHPAVVASVYDARFNTSETNFNISAPFSYRLDSSLETRLTLSSSFTRLKMGDGSINNNLAALTPGIVLNKGALTGHGFLGFALGRGGQAYVLPDIVAEYHIPSTVFTLSGGWQASVRQNTYEQLTSENPFLFTDIAHLFAGNDVKQTRKDELFASVSGRQGSHLTYVVRASWWNFTNLATYLDTTLSDHQQFNIVYDNVSAISLHGAVRYTQSTKWSVGVSANFYKYYQGSQPYVWHQPTLDIRGDISVNPVKNLAVTAYVAILGGMYSLSPYGKVSTLSPITDIGGYAEYTFVPRLSVFLQASNILNSKYERWAYYPSYGLNVYGGLRLKF